MPTVKTASHDSLAIRWFTPRGQAIREEALADLRHGEGQGLGRIVAPLRRAGVAEDRADLRGLDLSGEDLSAARLARVDLTGAVLDHARLIRADLRGARLNEASLVEAKLRGTNLQGAGLRGADLRGADLRDALLENASLDGARLARARLVGAWMSGVDLASFARAGVDLSGIRRERIALSRALRGAKRQLQEDRAGRPPVSEPRRSQRFPDVAPAPLIRAVTGAGERAADPFDEALRELLLQRGEIERLVVVIGGQPRVVFERAPSGPSCAAPAPSVPAVAPAAAPPRRLAA